MKKAILMYVLLIVYLLFDVFIASVNNIPLYSELISPLIWIILAGISYFLSKDNNIRVKDKKNKTESLIIAMIVYFILYYLLGLIFGFQLTPYSKELDHIIVNLFSFGIVIFCEEFVRFNTLKLQSRKKINFIIITIIYILLSISFNGITEQFESFKSAFIYIVSVLLPIIVQNSVLTYLAYIGGYRLPVIYRYFLTLPEFIIPIVPNLDWFETALVGLALPTAVFVYLNYIHVNKQERLTRKERKSYSPVVYVPAFILIAVLAGFVIGVFKYQPIAILSGSMSPTFDRGDAVVVKKLNKYEKNNLHKGDIIQYVSGTRYVVHRIVATSTDDLGNKTYITKGDYNNARDVDPVPIDSVMGKVTFVIPFIGYPSVWLSGIIS